VRDRTSDIATVLAYLVFAETDRNPMYGGHRASEAVEAICRVFNLDSRLVRERLLEGYNGEEGREEDDD
jgi:hypothetical protein